MRGRMGRWEDGQDDERTHGTMGGRTGRWEDGRDDERTFTNDRIGQKRVFNHLFRGNFQTNGRKIYLGVYLMSNSNKQQQICY